MASDSATFYRGYSAAFFWPARYAAWVAIAFAVLAIGATAMHGFVVHQLWNHDTERLAATLRSEAAQLEEEGGIVAIKRLAPGVALWVHEWFLVLTGSTTYLGATPDRVAGFGALDQAIHRAFVQAAPAIEIASLSLKLVVVRLALVASALPLLLLAYLAGAVDGLVERYVRRACGGRESSTIYHHCKYWQVAGVGVGLFAYLLSPVPVSLAFIVLPLAAVLALAARFQWKYFKKYV